LSEVPYNKWRDYDPEETIRFFSLRLREVGMIKSNPSKIIAEATDWRFLNEGKRGLKVGAGSGWPAQGGLVMQVQNSRRQTGQNRRRMLATLSSAAAVALIGSKTGSAQEAPPEVTTIRLAKVPGICIAPQYVAEGLLKIEGFNNIQYVEVPLDAIHRS